MTPLTRATGLLLLLAVLASCSGNPSTLPNSAAANLKATTAPIGEQPLAVAAAGGDIYCGCANGQVMVYGIAGGQIIKPLPLASGGTASEIKTFIDRRQVAVQDAANGQLLIYDAGTAAQIPGVVPVTPPPVATQLLHTLTVGKGAASLAFNDDNFAMASAGGSDTKVIAFTFLDDRTVAPTRKEFTIGAPATDGRARPLDFKGGTLLTADMATNQLVSLPMATGTVTKLATVGKIGPVAFGLTNSLPVVALAADLSNDSLAIVDLTTNQLTTVTGLGKGIRDMLIDPETGHAYLAMHDSGEIAVVDYVGKKLVTRFAVNNAPDSLTLAPPVPHELWVSGDTGPLAILDASTATPTLRATFSLGQGDHRMTFWGTTGFVSNQVDGTLSLVDREQVPVP